MRTKWIVLPVLLVLAGFGFQQVFIPRPEPVLDRATRVKVIDALAAELEDRYVFPDKAAKMAAILRQRQQEGRYDGITSGYRLARQLTADLHGAARDLHLKVRYHPGLTLSGDADAPAPTTKAEWEKRSNFAQRWIERTSATRGMVRASHMGGNVGYLKIAGFPEAFLIDDKLAEAMDELAGTDGLIVDVRENPGGYPDAVALLVSYFVDGPTRLNDIWDRETGTTMQTWTIDALDGKRYGGRKPVLILAGPRTASAGEDFAYTMQALGRATVIGAPTWGGAHPAAIYRLGGDFSAQIPVKRSISPITQSDWEGTGVIPDIAAAPDEALEVARNLMRRRLTESAALVSTQP